MVSEEGLSAAAAKKGSVMEINNKKNHLSHILFFFIMLLFAAGLTMNVLFCSNYNQKVASPMKAAIKPPVLRLHF